MDEMRKDPGCLRVSQWACSILRFVSRQETIIQECVIAPDTELTKVFEVYATDDLELFTCNHCVLSIISIDHLIVRLHVPIIIVFVFDRSFIENLRYIDVVVPSEATEKSSWIFVL
jgi:hypothetical protein